MVDRKFIEDLAHGRVPRFTRNNPDMWSLKRDIIRAKEVFHRNFKSRGSDRRFEIQLLNSLKDDFYDNPTDNEEYQMKNELDVFERYMKNYRINEQKKPMKKHVQTLNEFLSKTTKTALNESSCFYCSNCGERAEHEEIEENPRMRCGNCGKRQWLPDYEYANDEDDEYYDW